MKYRVVTFKLTKDLHNALVGFAQEYFDGNLSDAFRFILDFFFNKSNPNKRQILLAIYHNISPKLIAKINQVAHRVENNFLNMIEKEIQKGIENEFKE